jgi:hypothetical protein
MGTAGRNAMSCPGCGFFLEGRYPLEEQDDDWYERVDAILMKYTRVEPCWCYADNDDDGDWSLDIFVGKSRPAAETLGDELRACGMVDVNVVDGCGGTTWSVRPLRAEAAQ